MPKTRSSITLRLLKMIKIFPELYNSRHDLADDKAHSMVVWDTISYELDMPVNVLKKKWQRLRTTHKKRCRSLKTAKSVAIQRHDDIFNLMNSMLDYARGEDSPGKIQDSPRSAGCSTPALSIINEEGSSCSGSSSTWSVTPEINNSPRSRDQRKTKTRRSRSPEELKVNHSANLTFPIFSARENSPNSPNDKCSFDHLRSTSRTNDEPVRVFFESMALTVAKFPQHLQDATKTKICKIVAQAKLGL